MEPKNCPQDRPGCAVPLKDAEIERLSLLLDCQGHDIQRDHLYTKKVFLVSPPVRVTRDFTPPPPLQFVHVCWVRQDVADGELQAMTRQRDELANACRAADEKRDDLARKLADIKAMAENSDTRAGWVRDVVKGKDILAVIDGTNRSDV
jgi:hypothetical protein